MSKETELNLAEEVVRGAIGLVGGVTVVVVGGVLLEHVVRKMDAGLFRWPWSRPGQRWAPGPENQFQEGGVVVLPQPTQPPTPTPPRPPPPGVPAELLLLLKR